VNERKIARGRSTKKDEREWIRGQLGEQKRKEIMAMDVDNMEEEIRKTEEAIDDNLHRTAKRAGIAIEQGVPLGREQSRWEASCCGCCCFWELLEWGQAHGSIQRV
jgi:hypothetical protein